jgi:hypothetical protein
MEKLPKQKGDPNEPSFLCSLSFFLSLFLSISSLHQPLVYS